MLELESGLVDIYVLIMTATALLLGGKALSRKPQLEPLSNASNYVARA